MNPKASGAIIDTATGIRATTALNANVLPPPLLQLKDLPPPPPSPQAPPRPEKNEVLTNLVNLLCQQSNRLERMEKNQERIPTVISMHIK